MYFLFRPEKWEDQLKKCFFQVFVFESYLFHQSSWVRKNQSKQIQIVSICNFQSLHFAPSCRYSIKSLTDVCLLRRSSPLIQQADRRLLPERPPIYFAHAHALFYLWFKVIEFFKKKTVLRQREG